MTAFNQTLTANLTSSGKVSPLRWYSGAFKESSVGTIRAVSRAIFNFITQNQNLT